jgi:hypothetical protein
MRLAHHRAPRELASSPRAPSTGQRDVPRTTARPTPCTRASSQIPAWRPLGQAAPCGEVPEGGPLDERLRVNVLGRWVGWPRVRLEPALGPLLVLGEGSQSVGLEDGSSLPRSSSPPRPPAQSDRVQGLLFRELVHGDFGHGGGLSVRRKRRQTAEISSTTAFGSRYSSVIKPRACEPSSRFSAAGVPRFRRAPASSSPGSRAAERDRVEWSVPGSNR